MPTVLERRAVPGRSAPTPESPETLRVQTVRCPQELKRYRSDWTALHRRCSGADLFNSFEWVTSWLESFWQDRPISFRLIWDGGRLVGMLPLVVDRTGDLWCRGGLVTPVNPHTTRCDILVEAPGRAVWDAVLRQLRASGEKRGTPLVLKRLPTDSPILNGLREAASALGHWVHVEEEPPSPTVRTSADWDTFLRDLPKHTRGEIRRKRRRLERAGRFEVRVLARADDVEDALSAVLDVEAPSWKEHAGTSLLSEEGADRFYPTLMRRCGAAGTLRAYLLYLDDVPLAHVLCSVERGALYALKTSYRQDAADLSPGSVLMGWVLEDAARRGEPLVDLLGTECDWKRKLANGHRHTCSVCIFDGRSLRCRICRVMEERVKPSLRRHTPNLVKLTQGAAPRAPGGPSDAPEWDSGGEP